jgi:hypothetical protein
MRRIGKDVRGTGTRAWTLTLTITVVDEAKGLGDMAKREDIK